MLSSCWSACRDGGCFLPQAFLVFQDDHKLSLDELHRKYGTDLSRVGRLCFPSLLALISKGTVSAQNTSQREIWVVWFFLFLFNLPSSSEVSQALRELLSSKILLFVLPLYSPAAIFR